MPVMQKGASVGNKDHIECCCTVCALQGDGCTARKVRAFLGRYTAFTTPQTQPHKKAPHSNTCTKKTRSKWASDHILMVYHGPLGSGWVEPHHPTPSTWRRNHPSPPNSLRHPPPTTPTRATGTETQYTHHGHKVGDQWLVLID